MWNSLLKLTSGEAFNVAVDSTGFSRTNPSFHFVKRNDRKKPVNGYAKVSVFFCIERRKFLALRIRMQPRHDIKGINYLLRQNHEFKKLFVDSAYDAERLHEKLFYMKIRAVIKPKRKVHRGHFRKKQMRNYSEEEYHQRSLVESGFSVLKRKYGSYILARKAQSIRAEIYCKAIAYNLSLVNREIFNRACVRINYGTVSG